MGRRVRTTSILVMAILVMVAAACEVTAPPPIRDDRLDDDVWSLRFDKGQGLRLERRSGGTVAGLRGVRLVLGPDKRATLLPFETATRRGEWMVLTCAAQPDHRVEVRLRLRAGGNLDVAVTDAVALRSDVAELTLDYSLEGLQNPDETWLPQLHPGPDQVAGDSSFHVPLVFVRARDLAVSLVPDRELLGRERRIPQAIELDPATRPGPRLRHGLISHEVLEGGGFRRAAGIEVQAETLRFAHTLRLHTTAAAATLDAGTLDTGTLDAMVHELWRGADADPSPAVTSIDRASKEVFTGAVDENWLDLSHRGNRAGTFVTGRLAKSNGVPGKDAWYSVRHQSLRTAFGLHQFALRTERPGLRANVEQALAHVLTAPSRAGLIPGIFVADPKDGEIHWILDSKRAGYSDHYHAMDVATTCYWMLRLVDFFPKRRPEVLATCRRTARFLRRNQLSSGGFPSFFEQRYLAPRLEHLYSKSAATGSVARFLIEYGVRADDPEAIAASRRALTRVSELFESGQWLDFESSGPDDLPIGPRSRAPRQGTLGLIHCALAAFRLNDVRPEPRLVALGARLLEHLARYQQVWAPPWIPNARPGGFGAGNFDHRWNDARQGLAAWAFLEGYLSTGDAQWLSRGSAALRVAFQCGDREFQPPGDTSGPLATLHWGRGSACTVAELLRARLGQGVVDLKHGVAFGIDSIFFEDVELAEGEIRLRLLTHAPDLDTVLIRFHNIPVFPKPQALVVNGTNLGEMKVEQLRRGLRLRPVFVPVFRYRPPIEIRRNKAWFPRVVVSNPETIGAANRRDIRLEIHVGENRVETIPIVSTNKPGLLTAKEEFVFHGDVSFGTTIRSRLLFRVGERTWSVPKRGFHLSRVSEYDSIDPGDGLELDLQFDHGSRRRRFVDGREYSRHAGVGNSFGYRIEVPARATKVEFKFLLVGRVRITSGDLVLHEDEDTVSATDEREVSLELADHRVWADGNLPLHFSPAVSATVSPAVSPDVGSAGVDVALIRYRTLGEVASTKGLGKTDTKRTPDQRLHILVQAVTLPDRPVHVDREALQLTFFGGPDHKLTPPPKSQETVGSVAKFIEALSGGRTTLQGETLKAKRWDVLAADLKKTKTLPEQVASQLEEVTRGRRVHLFVVVLGKGSIPASRTFEVSGRKVPVLFLPAESGDGSFLACGTATTEILRVCYGIQPLATPEWGNFGRLALSSTIDAHAHMPPGPTGINLTRVGWSDSLVLELKDHEKIAVSPLSVGRTAYVLDCSSIPGGGRLHLEARATAAGEPGLGATGLLLYWALEGQQPWLQNLEKGICRPAILRVSPARNRVATPFHAGEPEDLFQVATSRLPTESLTGERLWEIRNYKPGDEGKATLDVRYVARQPLRESTSRWLGGPSAELLTAESGNVQRADGKVRVTVAGGVGRRVRFVAPARNVENAKGKKTRFRSSEPSRLFCKIRGLAGDVDVTVDVDVPVGGDANTRLTTTLATKDSSRWLEADVPPCTWVYLDITNRGDRPGTVEIDDLIFVPRIAPLHLIRPPGVKTVSRSHLSNNVCYGRAIVLPASGKKKLTIKSPIVLPRGPVALRIRAGLPFAAPSTAEVKLSLTLLNKDASQRRVLLQDVVIRRASKQVFLGIIELPSAEDDRVEFLEVERHGTGDLYIVDLAVIRP